MVSYAVKTETGKTIHSQHFIQLKRRKTCYDSIWCTNSKKALIW